MPGGSSVMRYCPVPSVVALRTFSMRTGLAASTVTPGSTAPDASRTTPAMVACADAVEGNRAAIATTASAHVTFTARGPTSDLVRAPTSCIPSPLLAAAARGNTPCIAPGIRMSQRRNNPNVLANPGGRGQSKFRAPPEEPIGRDSACIFEGNWEDCLQIVGGLTFAELDCREEPGPGNSPGLGCCGGWAGGQAAYLLACLFRSRSSR